MAKKAGEPTAKKKAKTPAVPKEPTAAEKLAAIGLDEICHLTADCVPQRTIAAQIGVSWATLMLWLSDPSRSEQYARAREAQADKLAEDILSIADDGSNDTYQTEDGAATNHDVIARSRLRVDARKWLASKMAPKKYGDKIETTVAGSLRIVSATDLTDDELATIAKGS